MSRVESCSDKSCEYCLPKVKQQMEVGDLDNNKNYLGDWKADATRKEKRTPVSKQYETRKS